MSFAKSFTAALVVALVLAGVDGATIHAATHHARFSKRTSIANNKGSTCLSPSSLSNGASVVTAPCSSAASWTLPSSGSGMVHVGNGFCLDVKDGKNVDGTHLQIWECTGGPNQKFAWSGGQMQWKGTNKCVDLTNGNHASGNPIQIWQCYSGNTNQMWTGPSGGSTSSGSSSSSGGKFQSKLGLAYPDGSASELSKLKNAGIVYNWNAKLNFSPPPGMIYAPQLWGYKNQAEFDALEKTAELYFGMNEPNEGGQANMNPQQGIAMWKQSMKPLRDKGKKLCSPATSGNPNGLTWMKTFTKDCGDACDFDYVCVHWYDTTFEKFKNWVTEWHNLYPDKSILVTEFAPQNFNGGGQPSVDECWSFYQQAIPWAMSQPWIEAVFPYGFMKNLNINQNAKLMNSDGSLTSMGSWIAGQA